MRKTILLSLGLLLLTISGASAQTNTKICVTTTGSNCVPVSATNPFPVTGSFSAGGFAAATYGTPITATTGGATGTLPAGSTVVATNVGTTNGAYCKLGASSDTTGQYIAPNGGWFQYTVGAATQLTCVTSTSTTIVNMTGGVGLPTGTGGGVGGGGGGAITIASGAVSSGAYSSGSIASGAMVDLLTMRGTKAAGTAATNSLLTGGVYNSGGVTLTDGQQAAVQLNSAGAVSVTNYGTSEYPYGSTPSQDSDTGTTGATASSLPAVASNYQFVCGISVRANATAAATGNMTLSDGTWTLNFTQWTAPLASGLGITEMIFTPCKPASATGTAIALTSAAPGSGGVVSTAIWGYYKTTSP